MKEQFEDTNGSSRTRTSTVRQYSDQIRQRKKGQRIMYKTLHGKLKIGNELQKCKQFLLHKWHPSCYSSYKPGEILNEEMTRLWLRQVEHIRGYLWHIYSVTVNQVDIYTSFWTNMKVGTYPRGLNNPDWKQTFLWTIKKKTHNNTSEILQK
jgi:hypothetical protein